jgi:hypothetical protein
MQLVYSRTNLCRPLASMLLHHVSKRWPYWRQKLTTFCRRLFTTAALVMPGGGAPEPLAIAQEVSTAVLTKLVSGGAQISQATSRERHNVYDDQESLMLQVKLLKCINKSQHFVCASDSRLRGVGRRYDVATAHARCSVACGRVWYGGATSKQRVTVQHARHTRQPATQQTSGPAWQVDGASNVTDCSFIPSIRPTSEVRSAHNRHLSPCTCSRVPSRLPVSHGCAAGGSIPSCMSSAAKLSMAHTEPARPSEPASHHQAGSVSQ